MLAIGITVSAEPAPKPDTAAAAGAITSPSCLLELVGLPHQVSASCGGSAKVAFSSFYRSAALGLAVPTWPQVLNARVLVKPATVIQWNRKG
jgi:hypothetical protein